jgi:hypothetical protein
VARDATARQYDVDADKVKLNIAKGEITFRAKKGRLVDLDKLHESIWGTRLSGNTGMSMNWLDVTAVGVVAVEKDRIVLKVAGSSDLFLLKEDPKDKGGKNSAFARMQKALGRKDKVVSVSGRVEGWSGHFPPFLKTLPKKPRVILVKDFEVAKK